MANPNLPPEIVAKWREDFHEIIKVKYSHLDTRQSALGKYLYLGTESLWQGFLMARQSVLIELPNHKDESTGIAILNDCALYIEAQGYAANRE